MVELIGVSLALVDAKQRVGDLGRVACDRHACVFHGGKLSLGGAGTTCRNNRSGVAHGTSLGRGSSCDEASDWFFNILLYVGTGFFLGATTDFADHDNGVGIRVFVEHAHRIKL